MIISTKTNNILALHKEISLPVRNKHTQKWPKKVLSLSVLKKNAHKDPILTTNQDISHIVNVKHLTAV
jgi:hypothetical protein